MKKLIFSLISCVSTSFFALGQEINIYNFEESMLMDTVFTDIGDSSSMNEQLMDAQLMANIPAEESLFMQPNTCYFCDETFETWFENGDTIGGNEDLQMTLVYEQLPSGETNRKTYYKDGSIRSTVNCTKITYTNADGLPTENAADNISGGSYDSLYGKYIEYGSMEYTGFEGFASMGEFKNGQKNGKWISRSNQEVIVLNFKDGILHGNYKKYIQGKLKFSGQYEHGKESGKWITYSYNLSPKAITIDSAIIDLKPMTSQTIKLEAIDSIIAAIVVAERKRKKPIKTVTGVWWKHDQQELRKDTMYISKAMEGIDSEYDHLRDFTYDTLSYTLIYHQSINKDKLSDDFYQKFNSKFELSPEENAELKIYPVLWLGAQVFLFRFDDLKNNKTLFYRIRLDKGPNAIVDKL